MKLPHRLKTAGETRVFRLQKSLYGLKQVSRRWFTKLADALRAYGFTKTRLDYSLFVYSKCDISLWILVYVNGLIISGNSFDEIQTFKKYLATCFHMKDLGVAKYFIGLEVARSASGIYLCHLKYATYIVEEMGLLGFKSAGSPIDQNHKLSLAEESALADPERYRRLVGRFIYLAATRPDLNYSIHVLFQFMHTPKTDHWLAALKVVRYLKGTLGKCIILSVDSPLHLHGWCNSDWTADVFLF